MNSLMDTQVNNLEINGLTMRVDARNVIEDAQGTFVKTGFYINDSVDIPDETYRTILFSNQIYNVSFKDVINSYNNQTKTQYTRFGVLSDSNELWVASQRKTATHIHQVSAVYRVTDDLMSINGYVDFANTIGAETTIVQMASDGVNRYLLCSDDNVYVFNTSWQFSNSFSVASIADFVDQASGNYVFFAHAGVCYLSNMRLAHNDLESQGLEIQGYTKQGVSTGLFFSYTEFKNQFGGGCVSTMFFDSVLNKVVVLVEDVEVINNRISSVVIDVSTKEMKPILSTQHFTSCVALYGDKLFSASNGNFGGLYLHDYRKVIGIPEKLRPPVIYSGNVSNTPPRNLFYYMRVK